MTPEIQYAKSGVYTSLNKRSGRVPRISSSFQDSSPIGSTCRVSGSAHQAGQAHLSGGCRLGPARLGSYGKRLRGASVSTVCVECRASASEAVTAVTTYPSSTHYFLDAASPTDCRALPQGGEPLLDGCHYYQGEQYRQLARDCHFLARTLPPGESRSGMIRMAEEWDRLADQQERASRNAADAIRPKPDPPGRGNPSGSH